jgi:hypothetical protein
MGVTSIDHSHTRQKMIPTDFYVNTFVGELVSKKDKLSELTPDFIKSGRNPRVGVLINPLSGGNRNGLGAVRNTIAAHPQVVQSDVQTPQEVLSALVGFNHKDVDLLVANGGDGTVQAILTALFQHQPFKKIPLLVILQSGTTSMIAGDVGFTGSRVKVLERLFRWAQTGEGDPCIMSRPVLQVEIPNHETLYGMFFGAAGIYQGIEYCRSNVHTKGLKGELGPGLTLLRFLWAAARKHHDVIPAAPITVEIDQKPQPQKDYLVLFISTLERFFLGLHPFWGGESGPLHYTAVKARPHHLIRALPSIFRGRKSRHTTSNKGYFSHNAHEVRLNLDGGFTLDGQMYLPKTRMEIVVRYGGQATFLRL